MNDGEPDTGPDTGNGDTENVGEVGKPRKFNESGRRTFLEGVVRGEAELPDVDGEPKVAAAECPTGGVLSVSTLKPWLVKVPPGVGYSDRTVEATDSTSCDDEGPPNIGDAGPALIDKMDPARLEGNAGSKFGKDIWPTLTTEVELSALEEAMPVDPEDVPSPNADDVERPDSREIDLTMLSDIPEAETERNNASPSSSGSMSTHGNGSRPNPPPVPALL
jgi:hypothetical protein